MWINTDSFKLEAGGMSMGKPKPRLESQSDRNGETRGFTRQRKGRKIAV